MYMQITLMWGRGAAEHLLMQVALCPSAETAMMIFPAPDLGRDCYMYYMYYMYCKIYEKFSACVNSVYQALPSPPLQKGLGTRLRKNLLFLRPMAPILIPTILLLSSVPSLGYQCTCNGEATRLENTFESSCSQFTQLAHHVGELPEVGKCPHS